MRQHDQFRVHRIEPDEVSPVVQCLREAFAADPLMDYLFASHPAGQRAATAEFFTILLGARLALAMPALALKAGERIMGAVMGYDTRRLPWPTAFADRLAEFEKGAPDVDRRLAAYEGIAARYRPNTAHYYLGVIGIHPSLQGRGAGKYLLDAFCNLSAADAASRGVYLETASAPSLKFYQRNGFMLRGEGDLAGRPLWCVFLPNGRGTRMRDTCG